MPSLLPGRGGRNVGTIERVPSAVVGAALVAFGLSRRSLPGIVVALAGGEMIYRGATGRCPVYGALGVNTAEKGASPNAAVLHNQSIQVRKSIAIAKPIEQVYAAWRNFENLPKFMSHLESVENINQTYSQWVARGPAGRSVQWNAEIINEKPNEIIAWKSLPGADIANAGSVLFTRALENQGTIVTVELDYAPPAGPLGALIAKIFGEEPGLQVAEDLSRFKVLMETGEMVGRLVDTVQEASEESFPASDAPAWT